MRDTTLPVKRYKTSPKSKAQKRLFSPDKKLRIRKAKSQKMTDLRIEEAYCEEEPPTADSLSRNNSNLDHDSRYDSNPHLSIVSTDTAFRDDDIPNEDITQDDDKCEENLLSEVQDLEWRIVERKDDILEFKARQDYSQVFMKVHKTHELPIITCAREIPLDDYEKRKNEIKFYIVKMESQGK